ncbi:hypothetical protein ACFVKB_36405 [Rhodococcus sp. NPDC127530]|uniref:hypothetical protein n=1 Tax=unclassified Rhodococcus (in: high G+C Gram-positive bacteria) TaxID=192944 RepID=UPI00363B7D9C
MRSDTGYGHGSARDHRSGLAGQETGPVCSGHDRTTPPSTGITVPVMYELAQLARNTAIGGDIVRPSDALQRNMLCGRISPAERISLVILKLEKSRRDRVDEDVRGERAGELPVSMRTASLLALLEKCLIR